MAVFRWVMMGLQSQEEVGQIFTRKSMDVGSNLRLG